MRTNGFLAIVLACIFINGCAVLKPATVTKNASLEGYKYVFITQTNNLTSGRGAVYGGEYSVYGSSSSKSVNPGDVVSGILLKEGYTRIPELKPELLDETMVVNYGESGKRNAGLGYTLEVTIQFISAKTSSQLCSCTAEGQGETEVDDIREAITRCLSALLSKEKV